MIHNLNQPALINLVPATAGGGLQNAVSFVIGLAEQTGIRDNVVVACPRGGPVHQTCKELGLHVAPVRPDRLGRLAFEFGGAALLARQHKARLVFTLFGNAPLVSPGLYRISGFALSNILMPEIDFWQNLSPARRVLKQLKDRVRLWSAKRSHEIIVETDFLAERARTGVFRDRIVHVVKMEPGAAVLQALGDMKPENGGDRLRLLALTGPHPNKRLAAMGPIMARLADLRTARGAAPPEFLVSIDGGHPHARAVASAFDAAGASPPRFIGKLAPTDVADVLRKVDGLVNIARLESFSNNWVEAWAAGLPLVSTDADWARASCGDAAIYVDPEKPDEAALRIDSAFESPSQKQALIDGGRHQLSALAAQGRKIDAYMRIITRFRVLPKELK